MHIVFPVLHEYATPYLQYLPAGQGVHAANPVDWLINPSLQSSGVEVPVGQYFPLGHTFPWPVSLFIVAPPVHRNPPSHLVLE